ncbi:hypothetical protein U1Q18_011882 [Sarracenia purpurea var. burkii]
MVVLDLTLLTWRPRWVFEQEACAYFRLKFVSLHSAKVAFGGSGVGFLRSVRKTSAFTRLLWVGLFPPLFLGQCSPGFVPKSGLFSA